MRHLPRRSHIPIPHHATIEGASDMLPHRGRTRQMFPSGEGIHLELGAEVFSHSGRSVVHGAFVWLVK